MVSKYSIFLLLVAALAVSHAMPGKMMKETGGTAEGTVAEGAKEPSEAPQGASAEAGKPADVPAAGDDEKLFFPLISFGKPSSGPPAPPPAPPAPPAQVFIIPPNTPISVSSAGQPVTISQGNTQTVVSSNSG